MYWLPPDGDPIGPMALEASCSLHGDGTLLHVRQSGCDDTSARWTRYYDIISTGWSLALESMKKHLEESDGNRKFALAFRLGTRDNRQCNSSPAEFQKFRLAR
jgi:hypothetical protein